MLTQISTIAVDSVRTGPLSEPTYSRTNSRRWLPGVHFTPMTSAPFETCVLNIHGAYLPPGTNGSSNSSRSNWDSVTAVFVGAATDKPSQAKAVRSARDGAASNQHQRYLQPRH